GPEPEGRGRVAPPAARLPVADRAGVGRAEAHLGRVGEHAHEPGAAIAIDAPESPNPSGEKVTPTVTEASGGTSNDAGENAKPGPASSEMAAAMSPAFWTTN